MRANKIPPKIVRGMVFGADYPFHEWAEAYFQHQGWVLFDFNTTHTTVYKDGNHCKIKEKNKNIILSEKRTDDIIHSIDVGHYYFYYWCSFGWKMNSKMKWNIIFK